MSAYVNLGMIDPAAMARDAARARTRPSFGDEFVGFRESCYLWCLRHPRGHLDAALAVPAWARGRPTATAAGPPRRASTSSSAARAATRSGTTRSARSSRAASCTTTCAWRGARPCPPGTAPRAPRTAAAASEAPPSATRPPGRARAARPAQRHGCARRRRASVVRRAAVVLGWRDRAARTAVRNRGRRPCSARRIRAGDLAGAGAPPHRGRGARRGDGEAHSRTSSRPPSAHDAAGWRSTGRGPCPLAAATSSSRQLTLAAPAGVVPRLAVPHEQRTNRPRTGYIDQAGCAPAGVASESGDSLGRYAKRARGTSRARRRFDRRLKISLNVFVVSRVVSLARPRGL